jgi:glutamine synthetase
MIDVTTHARGESIERVHREAEEAGVRFVRLWFTDLLGGLKSFDLSRRELATALDDGMGIDGSSLRGFRAINESDLVALADPATFRLLPNGAGDTARMFCDVLRPDGSPFDADSREILRAALRRMESLGFDTYNVGPELEFFLFRLEEGRPVPVDAGGYYDLSTDGSLAVRREIVLALEAMGIPVEYAHHEVGPSQHEIPMRYADALTTADNAVTYRALVKEVAARHGLHATFMPKPLFGENGSGMHTHQSLAAGGENAMFDAADPWYLSSTARSFLAGQLRHAPEIVVGLAQWANSYKRLVPGYEAPVYTAWSRGNRSALVRVPHYQPGREAATRIEIRCPDAACNPYLAFALLLHAGLDGVEHGYDLAPPVEQNLYALDATSRHALGVRSLPESLGEAVAEAERSELFHRALGEDVAGRFLALKREEWLEYRIQVSEWELERYLPVL